MVHSLDIWFPFLLLPVLVTIHISYLVCTWFAGLGSSRGWINGCSVMQADYNSNSMHIYKRMNDFGNSRCVKVAPCCIVSRSVVFQAEPLFPRPALFYSLVGNLTVTCLWSQSVHFRRINYLSPSAHRPRVSSPFAFAIPRVHTGQDGVPRCTKICAPFHQ